jgi:hypothetical protein
MIFMMICCVVLPRCGGCPASISYNSEVRRAEREPGLRHPATRRRAHRQRDSEIRHHRAAIMQQDVLRLDVAVDHPVAVRVVEGVSDLGRDPHRFVDAQLRLAVQFVAQRLTFDERHYRIEEAVRLPRIMEREYVGVLEVGSGLDFLDEALGTEDRGEFGPQDFHRNVPVVPHIAREINGGHATGAQLALDGVAVGQRGRESIAHRGLTHPRAPPTR